MFTFLVIIHTLTCILLVVTVLMQSGRGGGLTDASFAAAESMFGAKTNSVLIKATTIFASIFLVTSLSLAFLSAQKDKSLVMNAKTTKEAFDPDKLFDKASENTQKIEINTSTESTAKPSETQL